MRCEPGWPYARAPPATRIARPATRPPCLPRRRRPWSGRSARSATWSSVGVYVAPGDQRNLRPIWQGPRPGGDLTWAAAGAVGVVTMAVAVALGDGREFMAAAACIAFAVVFAIRPAFGVYAIVIARPSMDLWADRSLANVGS